MTGMQWPTELVLRATLWLVAVCLAGFALRHASAARRHGVWAAGLAGLLLLPALTLVLPRWDLPALAPQHENSQREALVAPPEAPPDLVGFLVPRPAELGEALAPPPAPKDEDDEVDPEAPRAVLAEAPAPPVPESTGEPFLSAGVAAWLRPDLLLRVWAVGAALMLMAIAASACLLERMRRRSMVVSSGPLFEQSAALAAELGLGPVTLLMTSERTIPMTWGLRRAKVLLPVEAQAWSTERLRLVLLHELGHVRRRDCLVQLLGLVARALYWFHPLAWVALIRLRADQEQATDDIVLRHGAEGPAYAEHLLSITAGLRARLFVSPVALGMARARSLRRRLIALLDGTRNRRPWSRLGASIFAGVALAALGIAAALSVPSAAPGQALSRNTMPPSALVEPPAPARLDPGGRAEPEEKGADDKVGGDKAGEKLDIDALWQELRKKLKESYVGPIDEKKLTEAALKGFLEALKDPYTDYMPPMDLKTFDAAARGIFAGIGAQLRMDGERVVVVTPIEGSPALRAGLRPGTAIDSVAGESLRGATLQQAVEKIIGPKGTKVKLKVVHPDGVVEEMDVMREMISVGTVEGFRRDAAGRWVWWLDPERKIGYVHIVQFGPRTAKDLTAVLESLKKDGLKGLVLDLRFCPGGFLDQAIAISNLFLARGTIVTTKGAGKDAREFTADGMAPFADLPLAIVVNEATASAAEIVAGALRDNDRAILVGGRTYGKGSVQAIVKLDTGGALKVTTAYHFLPSGRNIQKRPGEKVWGVDPSDGFYVLLGEEQTKAIQRDRTRRGLLGFKKDEAPRFAERLTPMVLEADHADPQLAAALKTMTARLTGGEFVQVGKKAGDVQEQLLRLDELRQRRETLMQSLKSLEQEIHDLQKGAR